MNIIDAFVVKYSLDATDFKKGEQDVSSASKRLKDQSKKTFDQMETEGKKLGETLRSVRNETIGLGLAFMGASTITGFIANMMTGAASADRLGQTMNMSAKQIWAWRMAMKGVGGDVGQADAALSSIQRAKMGWTMAGDTGNNVAYARLGITGNDLHTKDPGDILRKLAEAQGKLDPQIYASLLQQIGLPASTISFLQQGKASVDKLLGQYEKDAAGQEKLAKETEDLQKSMATLQATITKELVPPLVTIAHALNTLIAKIPDGTGDDPLYGPTGGKNAWDYIGGWVGGSKGNWIKDHMGSEGGAGHKGAAAPSTRGRTAPSRSTGGNSPPPATGDLAEMERRLQQALPGVRITSTTNHSRLTADGNVSDHVLGRAIDFVPAGGMGEYSYAQMYALLVAAGFVIRRGSHGNLQLFGPHHGPHGPNDHSHDNHWHVAWANARQAQASMARTGRGGGSNVHIGKIDVHTKATDAHGIARDLHGAIRRHAVSQADRGVAP